MIGPFSKEDHHLYDTPNILDDGTNFRNHSFRSAKEDEDKTNISSIPF